MLKALNCLDFRNMLLSGAQYLQENRSKIDELNVFPVPDGDTGTNMALTMNAGIQALMKYNGNKLAELCQVVSNGILSGARGNSGVILSQLIRGICQIVKEHETIPLKVFVKALENATALAYSTVHEPKEGTILTVARKMSECARQEIKNHKNYPSLMTAILQAGEQALSQTPELLPVLKEANVVDSGGMGLIIVWKGFLAAMQGEKLDTNNFLSMTSNDVSYGSNEEIVTLEIGDIRYGYCTEFFIINMHKKIAVQTAIEKLKAKLSQIGDSLICFGDEQLVKVHVHTANPGQVLSYALELGEVDKIKIENMLEQNRVFRANLERTRKEMGLLSVSSGKGFAAIFNDLLVDKIVEGGQTANPSTDDIVQAIKTINAKNIFILPNNKNIILACKQAKTLVQNKNLFVLSTTTIPEGIAAALYFDANCSVEENLAVMKKNIQNVVCGQVTRAVRNSNINGIVVRVGDYIGVDSNKVLVKGKTQEETVLALVQKLKKNAHENITLYYGEDITVEDATNLQEKLAQEYSDCEVLCLEGGQAIYSYIVSLE